MLGLSLNLQFGLTGLVNFGQVLPFAIGAYGAGFAAVHGLPWWSGAIGGIVLAPLIGLLVILPAGRLAQDYWALITLGAGELFRLDFYWPVESEALEVDHVTWHGGKLDLTADKRRDRLVSRFGVRTTRITDDDVRHRLPAIINDLRAILSRSHVRSLS